MFQSNQEPRERDTSSHRHRLMSWPPGMQRQAERFLLLPGGEGGQCDGKDEHPDVDPLALDVAREGAPEPREARSSKMYKSR